MSKYIFARFSDVDSAERAARALRNSRLSRRIERLSIAQTSEAEEVPAPIAATFGLPGYAPYYGGLLNTPGFPFGNQYGPIAISAHAPDAVGADSRESLLRLSCDDAAAGEIHGRLLSLGAYEINVR